MTISKDDVKTAAENEAKTVAEPKRKALRTGISAGRALPPGCPPPFE